MPLITPAQVRDYVSDQDPADNVLGGGRHEFSDADILAAMHATAREYNDILPQVETITIGSLDDRHNLWFDGIAEQLYRRLEQRLIRQDIEFSAGEVVVSPKARQLQSCRALIKNFEERFHRKAKERKIAINIRRASGRVG